jgi:luciferase-type oxidoreductase
MERDRDLEHNGPARPLKHHPGFRRIFAEGRLTLGFMFPVVRVENVMPDMTGQIDIASRIDALGFSALWIRDVPLYDPDFGDVGQIYDPWVWLGLVAAATRDISLATGAIVLPLRHPIHIAKAAASVDALTGGRFLLGLASGDRPIEFPAFRAPFENRSEKFAEGFGLVRRLLTEYFPKSETSFGSLTGRADLIPKPVTGDLPLLVVGTARQSVQWIAAHADAWITYPRSAELQRDRIGFWHAAIAQKSPGLFKPFAQSLFLDLTDNADAEPTPIFLGYKLGRNRLIEHLRVLQSLGVHHVFFNLRHSTRPAEDVVEELGSEVLPLFPSLSPGTPKSSEAS